MEYVERPRASHFIMRRRPEFFQSNQDVFYMLFIQRFRNQFNALGPKNIGDKGPSVPFGFIGVAYQCFSVMDQLFEPRGAESPLAVSKYQSSDGFNGEQIFIACNHFHFDLNSLKNYSV